MKKNDEERIKGERNEWREGRKEEKKKKKCDKKMTRWRKGEERMKKKGGWEKMKRQIWLWKSVLHGCSKHKSTIYFWFLICLEN